MRWPGFALAFSLLALGVQLLEGYRGWGWLVASSLAFGCGFAWMLWLVVWLRPGEPPDQPQRSDEGSSR